MKVSVLALAVFMTGVALLACSKDSPTTPIPDGAGTPVANLDDAASLLKWRPLLPGKEYDLAADGAVIETFRQVGEPRLRVSYAPVRSDEGITFIQGVDEYMPSGTEPIDTQQVAGFEVHFARAGPRVVATFRTGESSGEGDIFGWVLGSDRNEQVAFIETLRFADDTR